MSPLRKQLATLAASLAMTSAGLGITMHQMSIPVDAHDDVVRVAPGGTVTVDVLTNDRYAGKVSVDVLNPMPAGYTVEVTPDNELRVTRAVGVQPAQVRYLVTGVAGISTAHVHIH